MGVPEAVGINLLSNSSKKQELTSILYVSNLNNKANEEILWELFTQAGQVAVSVPIDRASGKSLGYGFVEFKTCNDSIYASKIFNMIRLYGRPLRISQSSHLSTTSMGVGAKLFIGNLDEEVDEK